MAAVLLLILLGVAIVAAGVAVFFYLQKAHIAHATELEALRARAEDDSSDSDLGDTHKLWSAASSAMAPRGSATTPARLGSMSGVMSGDLGTNKESSGGHVVPSFRDETLGGTFPLLQTTLTPVRVSPTKAQSPRQCSSRLEKDALFSIGCAPDPGVLSGSWAAKGQGREGANSHAHHRLHSLLQDPLVRSPNPDPLGVEPPRRVLSTRLPGGGPIIVPKQATRRSVSGTTHAADVSADSVAEVIRRVTSSAEHPAPGRVRRGPGLEQSGEVEHSSQSVRSSVHVAHASPRSLADSVPLISPSYSATPPVAGFYPVDKELI
eukprot:TRINITY_DN32542_c0_g1_i1.p1 TRINITY_DN32542_c0_g1~~TRINITY_DN32542_c0_g1_i1.p1  ORF type:complete len:321 (+),score=66.10 TRINITY_DN32542_c0_g1_i1:170-1132(+)